MMAPVIGFARAIAAALLGAGLGVQLFFSFMVAPAAFVLIDRGLAVRLMEGLFPGYYGFGLGASALALAFTAYVAVREPTPLRWGVVALLAVVVAGSIYAGHVLLPEVRAARLRAQAAAARDLAPLEFSRLHRRAVAVNITLFGVGVVALLLHAAAPGRSR